MSRTLLVFTLGACLNAFSQAPPTPPLISPEVHPDKRVTFRFRNPNAKEVLLAREGAQRVAMKKDDQGVWTLTTDPLEPDFYGYSFVADDVGLMDPGNSQFKPNLLNPQNIVHVPGPGLPWEVSAVPRGSLHRHFHHSAIVGDDRDFYVYTPPGYDAKGRKLYPVLYLLHGFSDDAGGWTSVGRAHIILDNLIAQGKAQPMLVVMPLGYGTPEIVSRTGSGFSDPALRMRNFDKFRDALFEEVMPTVEKVYRASKDRAARAIAGLSMGGAESLYTGLNAINRFAYVGAFSSGGLGDDFASAFPKLDTNAASQLRLLWIACGRDDFLIDFNRKFVEWLKTKSIEPTWVETPGAHTWMVWRRYLATLAPLLFQKKTS